VSKNIHNKKNKEYFIEKIKQIFKKQIIINISSLYLVQLFGTFIPLLLIPHLSKSLSGNVFGYYILLEGFGVWLSVVYEYGISLSGTRDIAQNKYDKKEISYIVSRIYMTKILLLFASLLFIPIFYFVLPRLFNDINVFILLVIKIFAESLLPDWYFSGMERLKKYSAVNLFFRSTSFFLILLLVKNNNDLYLYYVIYNISVFIMLFYLYSIIFKENDYIFTIPKNSFNYLRENFILFLYRISGVIYSQGGVLFLPSNLSYKDVGFYGAMEKLIRGIVRFYSPITQSIYPKLCYYEKQDSYKAKDIKKKGMILLFGLGVSITILLNVFAEYIFEYYMVMVVNKEKVFFFRLFSILPIIIAIGTGYGIFGHMVKRNEKYNLLSVFAGAILLIIGVFFYVEKYGMFAMICIVIGSEFIVSLLLYIFSIKKDRL